jgi:hypothetical protein
MVAVRKGKHCIGGVPPGDGVAHRVP